jgi:hypothetical protein
MYNQSSQPSFDALLRLIEITENLRSASIGIEESFEIKETEASAGF